MVVMIETTSLLFRSIVPSTYLLIVCINILESVGVSGDCLCCIFVYGINTDLCSESRRAISCYRSCGFLVNVIHSGCSGPLRNLKELRIWEYPLYVEIPRSGDRPECIAMRHGLQFQMEGAKN